MSASQLSNSKTDLTKKIKDFALNQLGVSLIGITSSEPDLKSEKLLGNFIKENRHAGLTYLENPHLRTHPTTLFPQTKSVIVIGINYYREQSPLKKNHGRVARYAYGRDYHKVIKSLLKKLSNFILTLEPKAENKPCVDSTPIMEKSFAIRAGLGFAGKNTTLINQKLGSFILLGELLTSLELDYDTEQTGTCGTCTRCIDACPTKALVAPGKMDANLCISYQTIENKNEIPEELKPKLSNYIFGCDICQEVCPYNKWAPPLTLKELSEVKIAGDQLDLNMILNLNSDEEYLNLFAGSPLMRPKLKKLKETAKILLSN